MKNKVQTNRTAGQGLVEFAIILTALLLLILGTIDLGRGIFAYSVIQNAAREGARFGSLHPTNVGGIQTATRSLIKGIDASSVVVTHSFPDADTIRVNVTYTFRPVTPMLANLLGGAGVITLTSNAQMLIE
jgi:Flp pilus assembly protein TadG